jgi:hypothetical protein
MISFIKNKLNVYLKIINYKVFPYYFDIVQLKCYLKKLFSTKKTNVQILGIMDYTRQPSALGDTTIFFQNLFLLKNIYNAKKINLCIVEDSNTIKKSDQKKIWIKKIFSLIPDLNNVYRFSNHSDFMKFRLDNANKYICFPNRKGQLQCDARPLYDYFKKNGSIPKMIVDEISLKWAKKIIKKHVGLKKLIVVQIRNSMGIKNSEEFSIKIKGRKGSALRDSNLPEWQKFFENLDNEKYRVICVCTEDEIIPSWRDNDLVLFSKDLGADVLKDFALIQCSYISLFPASGMFQFGFFCGTPSIIFNMVVGYWMNKSDPIYQLNGVLQDYDQFIYQSDYQKIVWEKEKFKSINYHFNELVGKLNNNQYYNEYHNKINNN